MLYKFTVDNRNYGSWNIYNANTLEPVQLEFNVNPIEHKLFSGDIFTFNKNKADIIHSSIRVMNNIPCVLILSDNKTYGRVKNKLLYKCIPDDIRIVPFLVPYDIKEIGFSKVFINLYVTINFFEWGAKHPYGKLTQVIGTIDKLNNFYEYQLYCKSLNSSIQKFNKDTNKIINEKKSSHNDFIESIHKSYNETETEIENRIDWNVFTIDPTNSLDFDDAFSIRDYGIGDDGDVLLSIYIANVTIWMDSLNLWGSFSRRISTIYLPDHKRPMLPTVLSDCLCSLQSNAKRFAFVMDIIINNGVIKSITYKNCIINVFKNFVYEEKNLLHNPNYVSLLDNVRKLSYNYKYINNIKNSHDVVAYLMILMNYNCAKELLKNKNGIFRSTIIKKEHIVLNDLPKDINNFIKFWNSSSGQYIDIHSIQTEEIEKTVKHEMLQMDAYVHITSPIRRLVDLLNIIKFQQNNSMITLSQNAYDFYDKWINEIEYINVTMRSIKKIQQDCNLLDMCYNNPETLTKIYDGFCFDKIIRNDGLFQFIVFLPELKLYSRITIREEFENYEKKQFKLFLFNNEEKFKKKIRLQLVTN